MCRYSEDELNFLNLLYFGNYPLKYSEMADMINLNFHRGKEKVKEENIYEMVEIIMKKYKEED